MIGYRKLLPCCILIAGPNMSAISSRESHRRRTIPAVQKVQRTRTMSSVMEDESKFITIVVTTKYLFDTSTQG